MWGAREHHDAPLSITEPQSSNLLKGARAFLLFEALATHAEVRGPAVPASPWSFLEMLPTPPVLEPTR